MMRLITVVMVLIMAVGCSSKVTPLKSYTLQTPQTKNMSHPAFKNKSIMVMQPQSLKEKLSQKMYFSYSPAEQGAYLNSRWSNDLGKLVQGTLIDILQGSGMFKGVISYASTAKADYRLESTVYDFSHHVRGQSSHAIVSIDFALVSTDTGKLIKSKRFSYMEETPTVDAEGYVTASNKALERLSNDLLMWLK